MRAPSGAWMTSCIPPDSSKKRSNTSVSVVGSRPSTALAAARYSTSCCAADPIDAQALHNLVGRMHDRIAGHLGQQRLDAFPQARHRRGQLWRPRRCLAQPERDAGRLTLCVLDPHPARLDAQDPIRGIAELEDVALQALDGEVLVESADEGAGRLEDDLIVGVVGDRAAAGDGGQSRATPRARSR